MEILIREVTMCIHSGGEINCFSKMISLFLFDKESNFCINKSNLNLSQGLDVYPETIRKKL